MPTLGYRDDSLFGEEITNPLDVIEHEIRELGNINVPHGLISMFADMLTQEEIDTCKRIYHYKGQGHDTTDEDWNILKNALTRLLNGRNFCKWLCDSPTGIYSNYIEPFDDAEERLKNATCATYEIPDDAICFVLPNDWDDGRLFAWKAYRDNTEPIAEAPLATMI